MQQACHLCEREADGKPGWVHGCEWVVCHRCIAEGRAIVANAGLQNWGLGGPINAYWDQQRGCQYCGRDYVFAAREQQFWYEEQRFFTQSAPVACQVCRKELRGRIRANEELSALGKASSRSSWEELEKRAELAYQAGSGRRALEYLRRAKNACPAAESKSRLLSRIKDWEERPPQALRRKFWRVCRWVEQIERQYRDYDPPWLSWEERQNGVAQPGLPADQTFPVAHFNGFRLEPLEGENGPNTWAWRDSDGTLRPWLGSRARATIDPDSGVMLWLPGSGATGRTGHVEKNGTIYGPKGPLPWL